LKKLPFVCLTFSLRERERGREGERERERKREREKERKREREKERKRERERQVAISDCLNYSDNLKKPSRLLQFLRHYIYSFMAVKTANRFAFTAVNLQL
jgi:hypothetical protein